VKRKINEEGMTVCAYMEKSVYEALRKIAFEKHTSVSALVREIIKKHLASPS